jgi:hypothetical protein
MADQGHDEGIDRRRIATVAGIVSVAVALAGAYVDVPRWLDNVPLAAAAIAGGYRLAYDPSARATGGHAPILMAGIFGLLYFAVHLLGDPMNEAPAPPLRGVAGLTVAAGQCAGIDATSEPAPVGTTPGTDLSGNPLGEGAAMSRDLADRARPRPGARSRTAWEWQVTSWTGQDEAVGPERRACDTAKNQRLVGVALAVALLAGVGLAEDAVAALAARIAKR